MAKTWELRTKRGYDFFEVSSAMQKSIRRGDEKLAGYFAQEMFASNYSKYIWKRLLTISAEDVEIAITQEILSLHFSFNFVNDKKDKEKGRIFISKAVILLCRAFKSRDADHLQCLVYDKKMDISDAEIKQNLEDSNTEEYLPIPDYAFDIHTKKGRQMGKTKKLFFMEENEGLFPIAQDRQRFNEALLKYVGEIQ